MSQKYDNTDTFILFQNDKKGNDRAPDRTGTLNVGGVEYFIDGWIKQGAKGPFLSGKIKPKRARQPDPPREPVADVDSDIPF
jgi:hypothetical protein